MINTTDKLVFLKSGEQLANSIREAINDTISLMRKRLNYHQPADNITAGKKTKNLGFVKYFDVLPKSINLNEEMINSWYEYLLSNKNTMSPSDFEKIIGNPEKAHDTRRYSKSITRSLKGPISICLLFLYSKRSLILSYQFPKINLPWLNVAGSEIPFHTENMAFIHSFLIDKDGLAERVVENSNWNTQERFFYYGYRILTASTWYSPEDVTKEELVAWRDASLQAIKSSDNGIFKAHLPLNSFVKEFYKAFKRRFKILPKDWDEISSAPLVDISESSQKLFLSLFNRKLPPLNAAKKVAEHCRYSFSPFTCEMLEKYQHLKSINIKGIDFNKALRCWISAQVHFQEVKSYENPRATRGALGRLNFYLFVYLPLWIKANPKLFHLYPETPNKFVAGVHMARVSNLPPEGRPLTYMEFVDDLGISETYGRSSQIRGFFDHIKIYEDTLEGCLGSKQPVHKKDMPKSKNYMVVQKNTFSKAIFKVLIQFLYSLETLQTYVEENVDSIVGKVNEHKKLNYKNSRLISTDDLGFVPIVFQNGSPIKIDKFNINLLQFLSVGEINFFYPGTLRLIIGMVETGLRGQANQWLDADTYDRYVDRDNMCPTELNALWVNTDKVRVKGFPSTVSNRVIILFDKQRAWKESVASIGADGFLKRLYYEGNLKSKWGKINPLFSKNLQTGAPVNDAVYNHYWTLICHLFQLWLHENKLSNLRLVAYIPKKISRSDYFTWEEWESGITENQVKVSTPEEFDKIYGVKSDGPCCIVRLRNYITPHGIRASFVSSMVTVLPAEYIGNYLTGQKEQTVNYYSKPDQEYLNELRIKQKKAMADIFNNSSDTTIIKQHSIREALAAGNSAKTIDPISHEHGLFSLIVNSDSGVTLSGLEIIAAGKASSIGEAETHLCPSNFVCPSEIMKALKNPRRCSLCPYAIFSVDLLPRVAAKRHELSETISGIQSKLEVYISSTKVTSIEITELEDRLNTLAEDAIGWQVVEESLWHLVTERKSGRTKQRHLLSEPDIVSHQLERVSVPLGSRSDFINRLKEVSIFPSSETPEFRAKIDQAKRLLLAKSGDIFRALVEPPSVSAATELVGMIRSAMETREVDMQEVLDLLVLDTDQWDEKLLSTRQWPKLLLGNN